MDIQAGAFTLSQSHDGVISIENIDGDTIELPVDDLIRILARYWREAHE